MTLRPLRPEDHDIEYAFVAGLSPDTRYHRLLGGGRAITRDYIESLVNIDYSRDMAIAATTMLDGERETLIGVARYVLERKDNSGEFAIVVADAWQGRGIGTRLLTKLIDIARRRGVTRLYGDILGVNRPMLELLRKLRFRLSTHEDPTLTRATLPLSRPL